MSSRTFALIFGALFLLGIGVTAAGMFVEFKKGQAALLEVGDD